MDIGIIDAGMSEMHSDSKAEGLKIDLKKEQSNKEHKGRYSNDKMLSKILRFQKKYMFQTADAFIKMKKEDYDRFMNLKQDENVFTRLHIDTMRRSS